MGGKKIFHAPDDDLMLIDGFFCKEESGHYYNIFRHDLRAKQ